MSYDVSLVIDTGGDEPDEIWTANHTSNTAPMWRKAGCDLAEFKGKSATELLEALVPAVNHMEQFRAEYEPMNPENGWGSVDSTIGFLKNIAAACVAHPKCTVEVWR